MWAIDFSSFPLTIYSSVRQFSWFFCQFIRKKKREDNTFSLFFPRSLVRMKKIKKGLNENFITQNFAWVDSVCNKMSKNYTCKVWTRRDISLTIFITLPTKKLESRNSLSSLSIMFVYRYYWMVWFGRKFENKREEFHFKCKLFCSFDALFSVHCL